jgi:hypothetical protein
MENDLTEAFLIMIEHNKYEFLAHHLCCAICEHQKNTKYNTTTTKRE